MKHISIIFHQNFPQISGVPDFYYKRLIDINE